MTRLLPFPDWPGKPPISVQACKVPLGYTQPQNKKEGKKRESMQERDRVREMRGGFEQIRAEQSRHQLDSVTKAFCPHSLMNGAVEGK